MNSHRSARMILLSLAFIWAAGAGVGQVLRPPAVVPLDECRFTLTQVQFVDEVRGENGVVLRLNDSQRHRIALATVRIDKPAGRRLILPAADLTLHFWRDDGFEVAACEGLSRFSLKPDDIRPLEMFTSSGPGWVKNETTSATTRASTVYFDAVFGAVPKGELTAWLFVAQTATPMIRLHGWD